jgi:hypothetical protein
MTQGLYAELRESCADNTTHITVQLLEKTGFQLRAYNLKKMKSRQTDRFQNIKIDCDI